MDGGITDELRRIAEGEGCEFVGAEISRRGNGGAVRVYIDMEGGVRHEECGRVSRLVSDYLDGLEAGGDELFKGRYTVEVSSPGIERPLFTPEHYARFTGRRARVRLKAGRRFDAEIAGVSGDGASVMFASPGGEEEAVPFAEIKSARLIFDFGDEEKKKPAPKRGKGANAGKRDKAGHAGKSDSAGNTGKNSRARKE